MEAGTVLQILQRAFRLLFALLIFHFSRTSSHQRLKTSYPLLALGFPRFRFLTLRDGHIDTQQDLPRL